MTSSSYRNLFALLDRRVTVAVSVLAVALLAACGDDEDPGTTEADTTVDASGTDGESDGSSTTDPDATTPDAVEPDVATDAEIQTDVDAAASDTTEDTAEPDSEADVAEDTTPTEDVTTDTTPGDVAEDVAEDTTPTDVAESCGFAAPGDLLIAEVLPSPAMGLSGDANCDGVRGAVDDEFVELVNVSDDCISLENVAVRTATGDTRVTFDATVTLAAGEALVLFGGNTPTFDGTSTNESAHCVDLTDCNVIVLNAAPGSLALDPSDTLTIVSSSGATMDSVAWGDGGVALTTGESLTRATLTAETAFETHGTGERGNMSPGQTWNPRACY